jgi:hypothetical protein
MRFASVKTSEFYTILSRRKMGTLAKSNKNANDIVAMKITPNAETGSGDIANPEIASMEAIVRSITDDPTSHRLGLEIHRWSRSRFV